MSYYFGGFLKDLLFLCSDRTVVHYPEGNRTCDAPKYKRLSLEKGTFVYCPVGNLAFGPKIVDLMGRVGCINGFFEIHHLISEKNQFQVLASPAWEEEKARFSNAPYKLCDILFGQFAIDGPYLGCISSQTNFDVQVTFQPGFIALNHHQPKTLAYVRAKLQLFLKGVNGLPLSEKKSLGRKFLPQILHYVSEKDDRVSHNGDLVFLTSGDVETFEI